MGRQAEPQAPHLLHLMVALRLQQRRCSSAEPGGRLCSAYVCKRAHELVCVKGATELN